MDVLAHALWAGAGLALGRRRIAFTPRVAALTVAAAVAPDLPHFFPIMAWAIFGDGSMQALGSYAVALPGAEPAVPPVIDTLSHTLHCVTHSAIVAGLVTLLLRPWMRTAWLPLAGWWSHIVIDVFTHSADYYPSPVLYPITRSGFDGVAWNTPWFMLANYLALAGAYLWLWRSLRRRRPRP